MTDDEMKTFKYDMSVNLRELEDAYNRRQAAVESLATFMALDRDVMLRTYRAAMGECERPTIEDVARRNLLQEVAWRQVRNAEADINQWTETCCHRLLEGGR